MHPYIAEVLEQVARRNAGEPEFLQAAREVLARLYPQSRASLAST